MTYKKDIEIDVERWYSHQPTKDFFILVKIDGMEFRSVKEYDGSIEAEKAADAIRVAQ